METKFVNKPIMKKDAMALVTGKPVYLDDVTPKDCLVVKVLRSPHANAIVKSINRSFRIRQITKYTHINIDAFTNFFEILSNFIFCKTPTQIAIETVYPNNVATAAPSIPIIGIKK